MDHKFILFACIIFASFIGIGGKRKNNQKYIPRWKQQACKYPSSNNEQSHYICDENGDVKCLPGWQGDICDVPMCKRGCDPMNGYCQRPGECRCKIGFYGDRCEKCMPLPGCQHGYCNTSFECICKEGWDGLFCSEPICRDDCHKTRGYCETPGECKCRLGWAGEICHDCQVLPGCQHGTCTKPLECKCLPGYTGLLCQIPTCSTNCSRQHGYCKRPGECRCKVGWMGENCNKCHPYPGCVNGDCDKPWECNCKTGWGGILCDEKLTYCNDNPDTCQNGGKCISRSKDDGNFRCSCAAGFKGRTCQIMPLTTSTTSTTETPTTIYPAIEKTTLATVATSSNLSLTISTQGDTNTSQPLENIVKAEDFLLTTQELLDNTTKIIQAQTSDNSTSSTIASNDGTDNPSKDKNDNKKTETDEKNDNGDEDDEEEYEDDDDDDDDDNEDDDDDEDEDETSIIQNIVT